MSAQVAITQLPAAGAITGTEAVPIVQNGVTVQTTTSAISASPSQVYQYLTAIQTAALPNSRYLSSNAGIGITDGGAQGPLTIALNGVSASLETASNGIIAKSGGAVVARTLSTSGAGLTVADGNGVSGNPTFSLTGVAASIANLSGTGMLAMTGGGTAVSGRDLTGTANQIDVTNGNGSAGNPTFSIASNPELPGSAGVLLPSGTTGDRAVSPTNGTLRYNTTIALLEAYLNGAWTSLASGSGVTSILTGTGLTGGPITSTGTISIANTAVTSGSYGAASKTLTATVNAQGQLTALAETPIAITNTQVSGLGTMSTQSAGAVAITGGTINATSVGATTPSTGAFTSVAMTTGTITTAPTGGTDIVNKDYADSIASGLNYHQPVNYATTTTLPTYVYNNGASGVGATITAVANGALSLGGGSPTATQRVLVKNEISANAPYNGVYVVTQAGTTLLPFILTRATDYDTSGTGTNEIDQGDYVLVISGTLASTAWVQQTPLPITVGTTALTFVQFNAPITYSAGTGLNESPAFTFNIANTAVTSGSYGGAATIPTFSVNAQGQLTLATDVSIAIAGSQITSGTVAIANGGTGQTTASAAFNALSPVTTTGDLIIGNGTNSATRLAIGANSYVLTSNGTTASWQASSGGVTTFSGGTTGLTPATATSGTITLAGTLAIANGGTNSTATATAGGAGYGTGTAHAYTAAGTAGQVLTSAGASAPTWSGISGGTF
tara:strand:- start:22470 stop:24656 length:2187 start_codon:yes stop_codon:yes gene_type:complete